MLNRRGLMLTAASAATLAPLGATARSGEDARLDALFDAFFQ